jgi:putative oxidoreductase
MRIPARYSEAAYALLRFVTGAMFLCHGAQKLFGAFGGHRAGAPLMWTAGTIELVGGLLIAIGLLTRLSAFVASGTMAAAYFMAHAPQGFFPIVNKGELAALYAFLFLFFAAKGGGLFSVDAFLHRAADEAASEAVGTEGKTTVPRTPATI